MNHPPNPNQQWAYRIKTDFFTLMGLVDNEIAAQLTVDEVTDDWDAHDWDHAIEIAIYRVPTPELEVAELDWEGADNT